MKLNSLPPLLYCSLSITQLLQQCAESFILRFVFEKVHLLACLFKFVGQNLLHLGLTLMNLCVPGRQLQGEVRCDAPGQVDVVLPLLLRQTDVFGPPVSDAGLHRLLSGDSELLSGQRVVPRCQPLNLAGLKRDIQGTGLIINVQ